MTRNIKQFIFVILFLFSNLAFANAETKAEAKAVEKAYLGWCSAIGYARGNPSMVVKYYAPGATLLPTLSAKILKNTNHGLDQYFAHLTSYQNIKCVPEKNEIHMNHRVAINSGLYAFSYVDTNGKEKVIPARFTFVYKNINNQWLIVTHHSSKLPE